MTQEDIDLIHSLTDENIEHLQKVHAISNELTKKFIKVAKKLYIGKPVISADGTILYINDIDHAYYDLESAENRYMTAVCTQVELNKPGYAGRIYIEENCRTVINIDSECNIVGEYMIDINKPSFEEIISEYEKECSADRKPLEDKSNVLFINEGKVFKGCIDSYSASEKLYKVSFNAGMYIYLSGSQLTTVRL